MLYKLRSIRERVKADDLTRHSTMMVAFGLVAGAFSYLYQLSMGILLTPAQYGTLFSLTSLLAIIMILSQSFQTSITKFVSRFKAQNNLGRINYLWKFSLKRAFLLGLGLFLALAGLTPLLSRFLNIENGWYFIILFLSFILAFALPVNWGILGGLQRFLPLGFSTALWAFLKFFIGILLVYLGLGIYGGLLPLPLAYFIVFSITLLFLKDLPTAGNQKCEVSGLFSYTGLTFLAILSFTMLTNIDVILVKHYLSPDNAGNYSAISVLGRIALYAPAGVAIAMFPKTSSLFEIGGSYRLLVRKAILYTLLLSGGVVIVYWFFPEFIVSFVFRGKYSLATAFLFKYGLAMFFFALSFLTLNYLLSLNQTKIAYPLLAAMILELGLITLFHSSIGQIVNIMLISGITCLVFMIPFYLKARNAIHLNVPSARQQNEDFDF
jgi:O-antigen/teichoic acid export membrane protein